MKNKVIEVQNVHISISKQELDDYICITDIAKAKSGDSRCADIVKNWLRNRNTLEFLGTWEKIYNPDFKVVEFDHFKAEAGLHTFVLSAAEWINKTNAISLMSGQQSKTYPKTLYTFSAYFPLTIFFISFSLFSASIGVRLFTSRFNISSRI